VETQNTNFKNAKCKRNMRELRSKKTYEMIFSFKKSMCRKDIGTLGNNIRNMR
jgi:hypothetical protein